MGKIHPDEIGRGIHKKSPFYLDYLARSYANNVPRTQEDEFDPVKEDEEEEVAEEHLEELTQQVKRAPNDSDLLFQLGQAYLNVDKFAEARSTFYKVVDLHPADLDRQFILWFYLVILTGGESISVMRERLLIYAPNSGIASTLIEMGGAYNLDVALRI